MELSERISILKQAAELAQSKGCLKLDDAFIAKQSINALENGDFIKEGLTNLSKVAELGQKNGAYTLKDAYFIYSATEGIENIVIEPHGQPISRQVPVPPASEAKKTTKTK